MIRGGVDWLLAGHETSQKHRNDNLDKYPDTFSLVFPLPKFPFLLFSLRLKISIFFVDMFCRGMPQRLLKQLVISNLIGSGPCTHVELACCRFPMDLTSEKGKKRPSRWLPSVFSCFFLWHSHHGSDVGWCCLRARVWKVWGYQDDLGIQEDRVFHLSIFFGYNNSFALT